MAQRKQTPGTGADGKSLLPLIMAAGMAFGLVRMVLRKRRDDRDAASRAMGQRTTTAAAAPEHVRRHRPARDPGTGA